MTQEEMLKDIQNKVGCLYQWMLLAIVLIVVGCLMGACSVFGF